MNPATTHAACTCKTDRTYQYKGMHDVFPVSYDSGNPTVNARDLHAALGVGTPYKDWLPRMCQYGFVEGKDFSTILRQSTGGRPAADHAVSIAMAKELCMLQRTTMGRKFRQYFIAIYEAWNSPKKTIDRALQIAQKKAFESDRQILPLTEENKTFVIALNTSLQFYAIAKYNKTYSIGWNLTQVEAIGKQISAYYRSHAIETRTCETNDERFTVVNSYPFTAWTEFIKVIQ